MTKPLTLRLDDSVHERLRREAFEQRIPMSDLIREAIREHIIGWDRDDSGPWKVPRSARRNAYRMTEGDE